MMSRSMSLSDIERVTDGTGSFSLVQGDEVESLSLDGLLGGSEE